MLLYIARIKTGLLKSLKSSYIYLILGQAALCWLATYLVSKISTIGKIGIALFYKEYRLLRSGWKTFLLFFGIQLLIILLLYLTQKRSSAKKTILTAAVFIALALIGLATTFNDFHHTYSHRLLKERFHLGFYLFWIGWITSCVFFIIKSRNKPPVVPDSSPQLFGH